VDSAHAAAPSPADSDDEVLIPRFSHCAALVLCDCAAEVSCPHPGVSCLSSSPSPPIARPQPALQAGGHGRCPLGYGSFQFSSSPGTFPWKECSMA
jgi:hypothetical protein